jgi:HSP20 family protein
MAIIKWDPLGNITMLQDRINKLFEDSFPRQADQNGDLPLCAWTPSVDIFETDQGVVVAADLPGVNKDEVIVEISDNVMTISGERPPEPEGRVMNYYRRERLFGKFQRTFTLHAMVSPDRIKAKFKNGVLIVEIPKPEVEAPRHISVDIE